MEVFFYYLFLLFIEFTYWNYRVINYREIPNGTSYTSRNRSCWIVHFVISVLSILREFLFLFLSLFVLHVTSIMCIIILACKSSLYTMSSHPLMSLYVYTKKHPQYSRYLYKSIISVSTHTHTHTWVLYIDDTHPKTHGRCITCCWRTLGRMEEGHPLSPSGLFFSLLSSWR